jgi:hypothetical protein
MNALLMYDRETESLLSQLLSRSVRGELAGTKLETIPLTLTTWEKWKEIHPETVALRKGRAGGDPYGGYYAGGSAGVIGESNTDDRLPRKELVLGLGFDGEPIAFPHSQLKAQQIVHTINSGSPAVVYIDPATDIALAYGAMVGELELSFELIQQDGREWLRDEQTGSLWVPFTGPGGSWRTGWICAGTTACGERVLVRLERFLPRYIGMGFGLEILGVLRRLSPPVRSRM